MMHNVSLHLRYPGSLGWKLAWGGIFRDPVRTGGREEEGYACMVKLFGKVSTRVLYGF